MGIHGEQILKFADDYSAGKLEQKVPDVTGAEVLQYIDFSGVNANDIVTVTPTANGQSATALIINPLVEDKQSTIVQTVPISANAHRFSIEASMNQRPRHQYAFVEVVTNDAPTTETEYTLTSVSQATTTLTLVSSTAVDWNIGDWVNIYEVSDNRLNYPNLVVATISTDKLTITATVSDEAAIPSLTAGPFTGKAKKVSMLNGSTDGYGMRLSGTSATGAAFLSKFGDNETMVSGTLVGVQTATISTTVPVFTSGATGQVDIKASSKYHFRCDPDAVTFEDVAVDTSTVRNLRTIRTGVKPGWQKSLYMRYRAVCPKSMTRPVAKIVNLAKTGTTTCIVTHDGSFTFVTGQYVTIQGARDQTNFADITTPAVITVIDSLNFSLVLGAAVTASSTGGAVVLCQGGVSQPGAATRTIQSVTLTSNILTLVGSGNWVGVNIGEYVYVYGCRRNSNGADLGVDGAWKVNNVATTSLVLEQIVDYTGAVRSPTVANIGTINAGGAVILMTTLRSTDTVVAEYTPSVTQIDGQGSQDLTRAVPTYSLGGTYGVSGTVTANQGTAATITATGTGAHYVRSAVAGITDIASAAITTTTTTASIANDLGNSFQVTIPVTAVSGTNPTLDVRIEESFDGGTNWLTLYEFQRITATGPYNTPILRATGRNIRYVQTIGGTATPSFTRQIIRNVLPFHNAEPQKRLFDRTIAVNTLNATSTVLFSGAANNTQLVVSMGAITTTAPQFKIQGSEDNGIWYDISTALTAVANSTVYIKASESATFTRAIVSTAGSGATLGYLSLKSYS